MTRPPANPRVVVFAGPNGAGKSTHADAILAELRIPTFVNAEDIKRRLGRSLFNFIRLYADVANEWMVFDNSSGTTAQAVAHQRNGQLIVEDPKRWKRLQTLARS